MIRNAEVPVRVVLDGSKVVVVGRFVGWKIANLRKAIVAGGATVVTSMSAEVDFMISGEGSSQQGAEALNMGIPILAEEHIRELLAMGEVTLAALHSTIGPEGLFGELRALFHRHESPSAWLWQEVTKLLDMACDEELEAMVAYVETSLERSATTGMMEGIRGGALPLLSPFDEGQSLDSSWEHGMLGEVRVAPGRWVGELYQGHESPKFSLLRGLDLGSSNLGASAVEKILTHPQLDRLEHLVTPLGKAPSKRLIETFCDSPWLERLKSLRLSHGARSFESWFVRAGTSPGALRSFDLSQYHASLSWECLEAPYFERLESLSMWDYHLNVFMRQPRVSVAHLTLHEVSFKQVVTALENPLIHQPLKTLRVANYHSADWKTFFELDYEGKLERLDIGKPVPYQRRNMLRYGGKVLQKLLVSSSLLSQVSTLALGVWRDLIREEEVLEAHPHLTIET